MQHLLGCNSRAGKFRTVESMEHAQLRIPPNTCTITLPLHLCCGGLGQLQARLRSLQAGQVVSRIAGMHYFSQKCGFTRLMTLGKRLFPSHFAFYPPSWNLPEDFASMQKELSGSTGALIVKPDDGAQGDGIFLATSFDNLMSHLRSVSLQTPMMVQRYLAQPLLLEGLKFDLRVYVFIASIEPLEVWVCREGLARFCTEKVKIALRISCLSTCACVRVWRRLSVPCGRLIRFCAGAVLRTDEQKLP